MLFIQYVLPSKRPYLGRIFTAVKSRHFESEQNLHTTPTTPLQTDESCKDLANIRSAPPERGHWTIENLHWKYPSHQLFWPLKRPYFHYRLFVATLTAKWQTNFFFIFECKFYRIKLGSFQLLLWDPNFYYIRLVLSIIQGFIFIRKTRY